MYLKDYPVEIPFDQYRIVIRKEKWVSLEVERRYNKDTGDSRVQRKVIGQVVPLFPGKMYPNENYFSLVVPNHVPEDIRDAFLRRCERKRELAELKKDPISASRDLATACDAVCVLKDARTCTALPNGKVFINTTGNDGMATAGSGDVLSGILAGLLAQHCDVLAAAPLAVYIHGKAGDIASDEDGRRNVIASDIIAQLKNVVR
jgi:hypothetical protein